tara:strand:- start:333 stop:590 length:258 start_codon:yes stop_codon:yes gene_type:complete
MRIRNNQGATMTPKCANLIRDLNKLIRQGLSVEEAEQYLKLDNWRCDQGYVPHNGDWKKAKKRIKQVAEFRKTGASTFKGGWGKR